MKKTILTASLVMALALVAAPVLAQGHGHGHGRGYDHGYGQGPGQGMGLGQHDRIGLMRGLHRLDLSDEQRDAIHAVFDEFRPQLEDGRAGIQEIVTELHETLQASGYDEGLLRPLVEDKAALGVEQELLRMQMHARIAELLTLGQREELREMRGSRGRSGYNSRKGGRPGDGS